LVSDCGSSPPPPTILVLRLSASPNVNPDSGGVPKPLRVRVLQLASTKALSQADFLAVDADPGKAPGPDRLAAEDLVVTPGQTIPVDSEATPGTRFVGVVGGYFAFDRAQWRAWGPIKPNVKDAYVARFGATEVVLTEGSA